MSALERMTEKEAMSMLSGRDALKRPCNRPRLVACELLVCDSYGGDCCGGAKDSNESWRIHDVSTGVVEAVAGEGILVSAAIGSCVAVAALDAVRHVGGMAHIMLPGKAPGKVAAVKRCRYAEDAIERMIVRLDELGAVVESLEVCLAGGGNVLRRNDDTICEANMQSVRSLLEKKKLCVRAASLGGFERRRLSLNVAACSVYCGEGDDPDRLLWRSQSACSSITTR
ncbi:MAG: hypothetical protein GF344_12640 [Chitinivibrionales bacterium]|nr:hypothetical protein [Chitinivibrionales bacterium]MBD3357600.1 hypothetical protein [Chitinivibrionales bacterium]